MSYYSADKERRANSLRRCKLNKMYQPVRKYDCDQRVRVTIDGTGISREGLIDDKESLKEELRGTAESEGLGKVFFVVEVL